MNQADSEPASLILRAVLALGRRLRAERPQDSVTLSALGALSTLLRLGAMPAARLAEEERLKPQSLTRIIAALEAAGAVARRRSASDRREIVISVTRRGRAILDKDRRGRSAWLERAMMQTLTDDEREILHAASRIMVKLADYRPDQLPL